MTEREEHNPQFQLTAPTITAEQTETAISAREAALSCVLNLDAGGYIQAPKALSRQLLRPDEKKQLRLELKGESVALDKIKTEAGTSYDVLCRRARQDWGKFARFLNDNYVLTHGLLCLVEYMHESYMKGASGIYFDGKLYTARLLTRDVHRFFCLPQDSRGNTQTKYKRGLRNFAVALENYPMINVPYFNSATNYGYRPYRLVHEFGEEYTGCGDDIYREYYITIDPAFSRLVKRNEIKTLARLAPRAPEDIRRALQARNMDLRLFMRPCLKLYTFLCDHLNSAFRGRGDARHTVQTHNHADLLAAIGITAAIERETRKRGPQAGRRLSGKLCDGIEQIAADLNWFVSDLARDGRGNVILRVSPDLISRYATPYLMG